MKGKQVVGRNILNEHEWFLVYSEYLFVEDRCPYTATPHVIHTIPIDCLSGCSHKSEQDDRKVVCRDIGRLVQDLQRHDKFVLTFLSTASRITGRFLPRNLFTHQEIFLVMCDTYRILWSVPDRQHGEHVPRKLGKHPTRSSKIRHSCFYLAQLDMYIAR